MNGALLYLSVIAAWAFLYAYYDTQGYIFLYLNEMRVTGGWAGDAISRVHDIDSWEGLYIYKSLFFVTKLVFLAWNITYGVIQFVVACFLFPIALVQTNNTINIQTECNNEGSHFSHCRCSNLQG
jgi:hypothetical protein